MIKSIIRATLGCSVGRAAVTSLMGTKAANAILTKVAENAAKAHGITCHTQQSDNAMLVTVGSEDSIEITIKVSDTAKMELATKALNTIKESGLDMDQIQKELVQAVVEQLKK